jgi:magnesium chelatase subunit D
MSVNEAIATPWRRASLAAAIFALDPLGSGMLVRAAPGPARDALLGALTAALAPAKLTRLPAQIADDRLIGGLDIAATLRTGRPVAELGALSAADGGVVAIAMAERMSASVAARLCAALDSGEVALQRDGLSLTLPARIGVVALDEGVEDERAAPALVERLAFWVQLDGVGHRDIEPALFAAWDFAQARLQLTKIQTPDDVVETLVAVAAQLGADSARAPLFALRAARAIAALRGGDAVEEDDITLAAALTLAPRATRLPAPEDEASEPEPEVEPEPEDDKPENEEDQTPGELEERVLEAARAAIPLGLLASLQAGVKARRRSSSEGKSGDSSLSSRRGRPLDARPGSLRKGRLSLIATLRAAAPWRRLREREAPAGDTRRIIVKPDDFRIVRYRQRRGATTVFVVDASGSSAMQRLAEAKGAIELLLADCYVRRDDIAMVAFRGRGAEIVLPPTRSTARAKRALAGLPGGGGTPIASGLDAALHIADQARRKGQTPLIVLMTDGRANIARDGTPGRPQALRDALDAGRRIRAAEVSALAIDTAPASSRGAAPTREIAEAMSARYVKLPVADAALVNAAVRGALPS